MPGNRYFCLDSESGTNRRELMKTTGTDRHKLIEPKF